MKNILLLFAIAVFSLAMFSFNIYQDNTWVVPASAEKLKNPTDSDKESLDIGKGLYAKHCKSCHGKTGEGDGPKSEELETFPGDFTLEEFQLQSDGAIFYKTKEGRDDMPGFKKKIKDNEDYWLLVNYIRTLGS